ncbi:MAG: hypothetical protein EKK45_01050 [Curvibacter sp.]|jgi:CRISPR-associated exonuclease Cas4|nr:MAG: hypothetical protein EKK45_01050 [Curvibacter sp.]
MTLNLTLAGVVIVCLVLLYRYGRQFALAGEPGLPFELRRAELIYAEQTFQTGGLPRLRARVDRAYRKSNGTYVLLELKTRKRRVAYLSDVIELSAQRVALMEQESAAVAAYGYVLTQHASGRWLGTVRVSLLNVQQVYELMNRRSAVMADQALAKANGFPYLCPNCLHRSKCMLTAGHG